MNDKKYFQIAYYLIAIGAIAIFTGVGYTKQDKSPDDDITKIINEFQNPNPRRRGDAFYRLVETGLGAKLQGQTYRIPEALSQLFLKLPDRSDELKLTLIQLLEQENSFNREHRKKHERTGKTLGEEYGSYYGDLIAAVAGLKDIRALNSLLEVITTGNMATDGLAALGDEALDPVIEKFSGEDLLSKHAAVMVLSKMLGTKDIQGIKNPAFKAKIKQNLIIAARDEHWTIRTAAVKGLAKLNEPDAVILIEELAKNDPYKASQQGGAGRFLVREVAIEALRSMRSVQPKK